MARNKFSFVVQEILRLLDEDHHKTWTQQEIVEKLLENPEFKGANYLAIAVKTLVASGRICGWFSGSQVTGIQHKAGDTFSTTTTDEEANRRIQELEKENNAARQKVKDAISSAEQGIKAANERVALAMKELENAKSQTRIVEVQIKSGAKKIKSVTGVFHSQFERILTLAKARKNIFIYGPTGCGKSYICEQVARSLNLPFYFVSCTCGMSEGQLSGRLLPVGKQGTFEYVIGEFVKAYESGGVFFLDEIDAADPNVLLVVNAALANGKMAVPNRPKNPYAKRHKDFICVAAANTVGTGADRLYAGRNKLDAATLDRFQIGKIFMDYDPAIEERLCPDQELRETLLRYRTKIRANRLERCLSTRFMQDAYEMKQDFGWSMSDIELALFQGWREDERNKVKSAF